METRGFQKEDGVYADPDPVSAQSGGDWSEDDGGALLEGHQ